MAKHAMLATLSAGTILKNYLLQKLARYYELMKNNPVCQTAQSLTYFFVYCVVVVGECHSTYHRTFDANNFSVCMYVKISFVNKHQQLCRYAFFTRNSVFLWREFGCNWEIFNLEIWM